ncbi:CU044_5270 family protein [Streptomyces sp. NPDC059863]|uniref:CU044_5270 family protein n=1 Tax=unclassified Streptomyces TaxID=2593676 RepID=UPI003655EFD4
MTGTQYDPDVLDFDGVDRLRAAGEVSPPDRATISAALAVIRAAAEREDGAVAAVVPRPAHRMRRVLISAATVAAIAAGVAVYPTLGFGGRAPTTADAATFLHKVADSAADRPASAAPYWKVTTSSVSSLNQEKILRTIWLSRTGMVSRTGDGPAEGFPMGKGEMMSWDVVGRAVTWDDLKTLPTNPDVLKARLLGDATGPRAQEALFNGIDALLSRAPAGPALRAALYEILAEIPGVRLVGEVKDSTGRDGAAVELDNSDRRSRLVISPRTTQLLEAEVLVRGGEKDGELVSRTTYLSAEPARTAPHAVKPKPKAWTGPSKDGAHTQGPMSAGRVPPTGTPMNG